VQLAFALISGYSKHVYSLEGIRQRNALAAIAPVHARNQAARLFNFDLVDVEMGVRAAWLKYCCSCTTRADLATGDLVNVLCDAHVVVPRFVGGARRGATPMRVAILSGFRG
jgi:hypothetical protein